MKRIFPVLALLLILISFVSSKNGENVIRLEGDIWAPYVMDPLEGNKGYMVEIAELVFVRAGYTFNFKAVPWSRTLAEVENGTVDGAVGIYFSQAREKKFIIPDEELGLSINKIYVPQKSKWRYNGTRSLDSITLGIISGYDYGELNAYISNLKQTNSRRLEVVTGNGALESNLLKVTTGRIHATIEDELVATFFIRKLHLNNQIKEAGTLQPTNKVGIAFSPKSPHAAEYARILSSGIQKLRKSGELKAILDKYLVKDWE